MAEDSNKDKISPRIGRELAEDYEWFIRRQNDGQYKGALSDDVQESIKERIGTHYARNPDELEEIEDPERRKRIESYVNQSGAAGSIPSPDASFFNVYKHVRNDCSADNYGSAMRTIEQNYDTDDWEFLVLGDFVDLHRSASMSWDNLRDSLSEE